MGLILDSSLLIAGERRGQRVWDILERVRAARGETESALSVLTVVELTHEISARGLKRMPGGDAPSLKNCVERFQSSR